MAKRKIPEVDQYIAKCPKEARAGLAKLRASIWAAAPGATERTDYFAWPGYSLDDPSYDYNGMFAWFSFKAPHIRLHVRPAAIQKYKEELAGYKTSLAVVFFDMGDPIPAALAKKLVKASVAEMKNKAKAKPKKAKAKT